MTKTVPTPQYTANRKLVLQPVRETRLMLPLIYDQYWRHFCFEYELAECSRRTFPRLMELLRDPAFEIDWTSSKRKLLPGDFYDVFPDIEMKWLDRYREPSMTDRMKPRRRLKAYGTIVLMLLKADAMKSLRLQHTPQS